MNLKKYFKKIIRLNRFQESCNKKYFKNKTFGESSKSRGVFGTHAEHLQWSFFVNILNGLLFSQYKLHHRSSTWLYIEIFKVKLKWSKSSPVLQRIAFLVGY